MNKDLWKRKELRLIEPEEKQDIKIRKKRLEKAKRSAKEIKRRN